MTNQCYTWPSEALAVYYDGKIVVCAESLEQAQRLALDRAEGFVLGHPYWDEKVREYFVSSVKADINAKPEIDDVLFIWGAD